MKNRYEDHIERVLDFHFCGAEGGWRPVEPRRGATSCAFQRVRDICPTLFCKSRKKEREDKKGTVCVAD
jgi:hypothetical protein